MSTDVAALQELPAAENAEAQEKTVCCMTWTVPGCQTSFVST
ncbi:ALQxL family class IV lanthipeptide [Nonomuraea sp. 3-1Str]|nr:ALQxL family class IV lanthipeptide [Nonomuraea sp. 3-1Str]MDR8414102.1 ALQxL family class IV lanthipeptide [Nonomuraea sp. 3-1Str]